MTSNINRLLRVSLFPMIFLLHCFPAYGQTPKFKEKQPTVPLDQVIKATEMALNDYQTDAQSSEGTKDAIPPLASADFDFKAVVDTKGGPSINLWIITLGATWEKQATNEIDFQYLPHVVKKEEVFALDGHTVPVSLYKAIVDTLKESAKEITKVSAEPATPGTPQLDLCQLTLSLSFGATTDVQGGLKVPFELITVSATLDRSKNNVQQVKLVFKVKDPNNKTCSQAKP
jgi:hypothetical protein